MTLPPGLSVPGKMHGELVVGLRRRYDNIRTSLLSWRARSLFNELTEKSKSIQNTIINSVLFQKAKTIGCYLPIKNEVMTKNLMEFGTNDSKIVAV